MLGSKQRGWKRRGGRTWPGARRRRRSRIRKTWSPGVGRWQRRPPSRRHQRQETPKQETPKQSASEEGDECLSLDEEEGPLKAQLPRSGYVYMCTLRSNPNRHQHPPLFPVPAAVRSPLSVPQGLRRRRAPSHPPGIPTPSFFVSAVRNRGPKL